MQDRKELTRYFRSCGYKVGAEIGVARGDYAQELLDGNPDLRLILIDPWKYWETGYIDPENSPPNEQEAKYQLVLLRFAKQIIEGKVKIIRATSMEASLVFSDSFLDFVYIDANHAYDWLMADILVWWQKVRKGGIFAGHDFGYEGVAKAVRDFENYSQTKLNICENNQDWYFMKGE